MLVQSVQPISRRPAPCSVPRVKADPAELSAKLRELVLRTYHAVRTTGDARSANGRAHPEVIVHSLSRRDWDDLHSQIVQLEQALGAQHLELLASYVGALREHVESHLV
jgi:hypothetical protein